MAIDMTLTRVYSARCDQPGCDARLATKDGTRSWDSLGALFEAAHANGWQAWQQGTTSMGGIPVCQARCPKHLKAMCRRCGATAVGTRQALDTAGWTGNGTLCPTCSQAFMRPDAQEAVG